MLNIHTISILLELLEDGQITLTDKGDTHILESLIELKMNTDRKMKKIKEKQHIIDNFHRRFSRV